MNRMNGMFSLCRVVAIGAIFTFTLSSTLQGQTMVDTRWITTVNSQNWEGGSINAGNDGWSSDAFGGATATDTIVPTSPSRGSSTMSLQLNADFTAGGNAVLEYQNLAIPTRTSVPGDGAANQADFGRFTTLEDVVVTFDLLMSEAQQLTFTVGNGGDESDDLIWTTDIEGIADHANMWNQFSFSFADMTPDDGQSTGTDFGLAHLGSVDMAFGIDSAQWGRDTGNIIQIDNFSIQIPEPEQYALIALILCGLVIFAKRRTAKTPTTLQS